MAADRKIDLDDDELRQRLGREAYDILRRGGTERAGTSPLLAEKRAGLFACAGCGAPLYSSATKYESGSGWPSFFAPVSAEAVSEHHDSSHFMQRTEIRCGRCGSHLGHVFPDGPPPTGLRYCMNGAALAFQPEAEDAQ